MAKISANKCNSVSVGNRIKSARMLSGYSRTAFSKISKISAATLRAWEEPTKGRYGLTEKGAERLVNALYSCKVACSKEWLLFGKGYGLSLNGNKVKPLNFDFEEVNWSEEESILRDIAAFKINNVNPIVVMVDDNAMIPSFFPGDYVGGSMQSIENLSTLSVGSVYIIDTGDNFLIRKIMACHENRYTVTSANSSVSESTILSVQIKSAAEIIWCRWRKKT